MRQQAQPLTESHISLVVMFLFLMLAIAFLAIVNVQVVSPSPFEGTAVTFVVSQLAP